MAKSKLEVFLELKRALSTKEDSFAWWSNNSHRPELGVISVNEKLKKISLRTVDETESTKIYGNLSYVDFGATTQKKDPLDRIMEVTGCSFSVALDTIYSWITNSDNYDRNKNIPVVKKEGEFKKEYPLNSSIVRESSLNRINMKEKYDNIKYGLFRSCTEAEISFAENCLSIGFSPVSKYDAEDRVFIPEFDEFNQPWGFYKYNRSSKIAKGLLKSNAKRVIFGSHLIKRYNRDIILCEGHTDVVVNISKQYASLTTGSATKKIGDNITCLKGKVLHDFPDLDVPGMIGAINRGREIIEYNSKCSTEEDKIEHIIYWWAEWMYSEKLFNKIVEGKLEEYDLLYSIKDQIPLKYNRANINVKMLSYVCKLYASKNKFDLPDNLDILNWKIMQKGSEKTGFDWIDFYQKEKDRHKVDNFMSKFKFK